jgi:hypothetical protein
MGANGWIIWEVDGLSSSITLFLCFHRTPPEPIDFLLLRMELLLLLFDLELEFGDPLADLAYFRELCFTTSQQKSGHYVHRRLEFFGVSVP